MVYVLRFTTDKFDLRNERENTINPIMGISVGEWLIPLLERNGVTATGIDEEDWGWYCYASMTNQKYLIGFVALPETGNHNCAEIIIQISKQRKVVEKLLGKNKLSPKDPFIKLVSGIIRGVEEFKEINDEF